MPCISYPDEHFAHSNYEPHDPYSDEASKVCALLDEVVTGELNEHHYKGRHPSVTSHVVRREELDDYTEQLCSLLKQKKDVTNYSLELQIWWRDHQRLDAERERKEKEAKEKEQHKLNALAKLTPYERSLLGHDWYDRQQDDDIPF